MRHRPFVSRLANPEGSELGEIFRHNDSKSADRDDRNEAPKCPPLPTGFSLNLPAALLPRSAPAEVLI